MKKERAFLAAGCLGAGMIVFVATEILLRIFFPYRAINFGGIPSENMKRFGWGGIQER